MATVRRVGDRWEARWYAGKDRHGKYRRRSLMIDAPDKREAQRRANLAEAMDAGRKMPDATVRDALDALLVQARKKLTARSYAVQAKRIEDHVAPLLGELAVAELDADAIERFHAKLDRKGLGPQTIRHCHYDLSGALKLAVRKGWCERNWCEVVDPPSLAKREVQPPSPGEVAALLGWLDAEADTSEAFGELALLMRIAVASGARLGEVLGLRWSDIIREPPALRIVRSVSDYPAGPGQRRRIVEVKTTKTTQVSAVPVPVALLGRLDGRRAEVERFHGVEVPWVFPQAADPRVPIPTNVMKTRFSRAKAGFARTNSCPPPAWRLHDLRHFAATQWITAGIPVPEVSALLRHSKPSTTSDRYWHLPGVTADRRSAERIHALLGDVL